MLTQADTKKAMAHIAQAYKAILDVDDFPLSVTDELRNIWEALAGSLLDNYGSDPDVETWVSDHLIDVDSVLSFA